MHSLLRENLEEYLSGNLGQSEQLAVEGHLAQCPECREEYTHLRSLSEQIRSLRPREVLELDPAPGFYARVLARIDQEREIPFWAMLLDPGFGRRVVFACLMLLALLGAYVAAVDHSDYTIKHRPEAVLAGQTAQPTLLRRAPRFGPNLEKNRSMVLATLVEDGD